MNIETAKTQTLQPEMVSYEEIASEYYDPVQHPTCANFRDGSAYIISNWLEEIKTEQLEICEVGAGDSLAAELLNASGKTYKKLYITDKSPSMLAFSEKWANENTVLRVEDAARLSFGAESIDLLISSLGDPYNHPDFWNSVSRILKPNGHAIFTTPAYEWSVNFRSKLDNETASAEFELKNGKTVAVLSYIYSKEKQSELLKQA